MRLALLIAMCFPLSAVAQTYHASPRTKGQYELGPGDGGANERVIVIGESRHNGDGEPWTVADVEHYNAPSDYAVPVDGSEPNPLRIGLPPVQVTLDTPVVQLTTYPRQGYFRPVAPPAYYNPPPGRWVAISRPTWVGNFVFGPMYVWQPEPQQLPPQQ